MPFFEGGEFYAAFGTDSIPLLKRPLLHNLFPRPHRQSQQKMKPCMPPTQDDRLLPELLLDGPVVYLCTFSKSLAPSIRIACMVLPGVLLERYRAAFGSYANTVSRFIRENRPRPVVPRILHRRRQPVLPQKLSQ